MTTRTNAAAESACDLVFFDDGSVVAIHPHSDAGLDWLADNCQTEPWQWLGNRVAIEPRYAAEIFHGARDDGLACSFRSGRGEDELDREWERTEQGALQ
jgi:hypothetical protein